VLAILFSLVNTDRVRCLVMDIVHEVHQETLGAFVGNSAIVFLLRISRVSVIDIKENILATGVVRVVLTMNDKSIRVALQAVTRIMWLQNRRDVTTDGGLQGS
jgi:hypothetical protein